MPDCVRGNWSKKYAINVSDIVVSYVDVLFKLEQGKISSTKWCKRFWMGTLVFKPSQTLIMNRQSDFKTILLRPLCQRDDGFIPNSYLNLVLSSFSLTTS